MFVFDWGHLLAAGLPFHVLRSESGQQTILDGRTGEDLHVSQLAREDRHTRIRLQFDSKDRAVSVDSGDETVRIELTEATPEGDSKSPETTPNEPTKP